MFAPMRGCQTGKGVCMLALSRAAFVAIACVLPLCLGAREAASRGEPVFSAICKDISGFRVDEEGGTIQTDKDGFASGTTWSYSWTMGQQEATLILQSGRASGGTPTTERALVTTHGPNVTFISPLSGAVWLHTIFPKAGRVLVTQHTGHGQLDDRLSGKMMWGRCQVNIN